MSTTVSISQLCKDTQKELLVMRQVGISVSGAAVEAAGNNECMKEYLDNPITISEIADLLTQLHP